MDYVKHLTDFAAKFRVYGVSHTLCDDEYRKIGFNRLRAGESHPEGIHEDGDEFFYVLEGHGMVYIDGESRQISENSFVHIPKNKIHSVANEGNCTLSYLYLISYQK